MHKSIFAVFLLVLVIANECYSATSEVVPDNESAAARVKRGGHGGGGGGGGHGHGPGRGGGAAGPVYICGYVGKTEGSGYGGYGR